MNGFFFLQHAPTAALPLEKRPGVWSHACVSWTCLYDGDAANTFAVILCKILNTKVPGRLGTMWEVSARAGSEVAVCTSGSFAVCVFLLRVQWESL